MKKSLLDLVCNVTTAEQSDTDQFDCSKAGLIHRDLVANLEKSSKEDEERVEEDIQTTQSSTKKSITSVITDKGNHSQMVSTIAWCLQ